MLIIGADDDVRTKMDLGQKLRELCEALLEDDSVIEARARIESFLQNPEATRSYGMLAQLNDQLHAKEQAGEKISEDDIQQFDALRTKVMGNDLVQEFAQARGALQEVEGMVMAFVSKTLEMGRVPTERELATQGGGSCGSGCGCH
jgi:cell fate (sporulation/competence/biofilm development) regulator YlbF (YheA/YmcA/DUF963 family)